MKAATDPIYGSDTTPNSPELAGARELRVIAQADLLDVMADLLAYERAKAELAQIDKEARAIEARMPEADLRVSLAQGDVDTIDSEVALMRPDPNKDKVAFGDLLESRRNLGATLAGVMAERRNMAQPLSALHSRKRRLSGVARPDVTPLLTVLRSLGVVMG